MSLLYANGFDDPNWKYRANSDIFECLGLMSDDPGVGREGGRALRGSGSGNCLSSLVHPTGADTLVVGHAVFGFASAANSPSYSWKFNARDDSDVIIASITIVGVDLGGDRFEVTFTLEDKDSLTIDTYIKTMYVYNWDFIEMKIERGVAGFLDFRIDGKSVLSGIGNYGTALLKKMEISTYRDFRIIDDLYFLDGTGTTNNDFLGDVRVHSVQPYGIGQDTDFTPVGAATNWEALLNPSSGTMYNTGDMISMRDTYSMGNPSIPAASTVLGVVLHAEAKRASAGYREISFASNFNLVPETLGGDFVLLDSYKSFALALENDPVTGNPWIVANIDNTEFGLEITE